MDMMYKAGDKVRIRADLKIGEKYGVATLVLDMDKYLGKITTIRHVYTEYYTLDIDDGYWTWTDEMFESDEKPEILESETLDVWYKIDGYGSLRVLKDVIQGDTGIKRIYYTKDYGFQYILPIDWIECIVPHKG